MLQLICPELAHSQQPFQRTIGLQQSESVHSVLPVSNGYLILAKTNSDGAGQYDILLVKTDFNFNLNWSKTIGGPSNEYPRTFIECSDGGSLIVGSTYSFGQGGDDILAVKLNSSHDIDWVKTYGSIGSDRGYCVIETTDGYLIGGHTDSGEGAMALKIDQSGNIIWSKTYGSSNISGKFYDVLETDDGNYLFEGPFSQGGNNDDYNITCISPSGDVIMSINFNAPAKDTPLDIIHVSGEGYYILGQTRSFGGMGRDLLLVKTDLGGNTLWAKTYSSNEDLWAAQLTMTSQNEILLCGHSDLMESDMLNNDLILLSCQPTGDLNWAKSYGGAGSELLSFGAHETLFEVNPNFYTLVGHTNSFGQGSEDIYVIGFDMSGTSGCNEFDYNMNVSDQSVPSNSITLPAVIHNPLVSSPSLTVNLITLTDTLLCPTVQAPTALLAASDSSFCRGGCIDFMDMSLQDPDHWEWEFEGGVPAISSEQFPTGICYPDTGCFDVTLTVSNSAGTDSRTFSDFICVYGSPEFSLGNDTILCYGDSIEISAPVGFPIYLWNTGATERSITVSQSGDYSVEIDDGNGCSASDTINISFNAEVSVYIGPDSAVCEGDYVVLTADPGYATYLWQDGSGQQEFVATTTGYYWVEVADNLGCSASDTAYIKVVPNPVISLGPDAAVCEGDSVVLTADPGYDTYLWQDGSDQQEFIAKSTGYYWVEVTGNLGCSASDTVYVEVVVYPVISLGPDSTICEGESVWLNPGPGYGSYRWQDGSTQQEFQATVTGTYWVEVENGPGCTGSDTVFIELIQLPYLSIGNDTTVCEEFMVLLDAGSGYDMYEWQDGSDGQTFTASDPGTYWVLVDIRGCWQGDTISIIEECPSHIYFPNSFTPNGDGKNDVFAPAWEYVDKYKMSIYNRWGTLVFETNNIEQGWDGTFNGGHSPTGVYVFIAEYLDAISGKTFSLKGSIMLLR